MIPKNNECVKYLLLMPQRKKSSLTLLNVSEDFLYPLSISP